ncbi:MAG: LAGLIDADG family homing endonuclease [Cyanobacteriota bacterium]|nr:LAGLIDADG family homing endonuclease [Cyanobacteriota bacterium]
MDADGSFKTHITFTSASKQFVIDFQDYLKIIGITSKTTHHQDVATRLYIPAKHKIDFIQHIGVLNPKKADDYFEFLKHKRSFSKYHSLNERTLTKNGYFNLELMNSLFINGLCEYLKSYRGDKTYSDMREELDLAIGSYSNYEKGKTALPFLILQKIVQNQSGDKQSIYTLLEKKKKEISYQVSTSMVMKFPLKPTNDFCKILPFLEPKINYVRVLTEEQSIIKEIEQMFSFKINGSLIKSNLLVHFLRTYCNYEETDYYLSMTEFKLLQQKWRNEILDVI